MSSAVQLQSFKDTESQMERSPSQVDIGIPDKKKDRSPLIKIVWVVVVLALAVAVVAVVAVVVVTQQFNEVDKFLNIPHSAAQIKTTPKTTGSETTTRTVITTQDTEDHSVCLKTECVVAAARLYQNMDETVHPCDEFYKYACGGWIKNNRIPEDGSVLNTIHRLSETLLILRKELLETVSSEGELEAITKAKNLYKSCLDEERIEQRGLEPLQMIYSVFGKWPLLQNSWNETGFDLIDSMVARTVYDHSPLIALEVVDDPLSYSHKLVPILKLGLPDLLLPNQEYYISTDHPLLLGLRGIIVNLAAALGAEDMTIVNQDVDAMLQFETAVVNLMPNAGDDPSNTRPSFHATINELDMFISNKFDWMRFIGGVMNTTGVDIPITDDELITVVDPSDYLRNVIDLIDNTPPRVLANYLSTELIMRFAVDLPVHIRKIVEMYTTNINRHPMGEPRWKLCENITSNVLANAVGRLFVDNFFDEDAHTTVSDMVANLKSAFKDQLNELDWLGDATRKGAKDKLDAMKAVVGYLELNVKNDTHLNEQYKELTYDPTKYFENYMMTVRLNQIQMLKKLRQPTVNIEQVPTASTRAIYFPPDNALFLPAGILQPPFFLKHYPKSVNYGGIGVIIGHEIMHGFDDIGRLYDKNGDLKSWWNQSSEETFTAKAQCLVEQYSNFTVPEVNMKVNGTKTLGENIADNAAITQAFRAYREWVRKQGKEEPMLPGLKLNNNQLFFLSFAQSWCAYMGKAGAEDQILNDDHSPGRYRVLGSLQNSKEFSKVFNCPKSFMNPQMKCRVW